MLVLPRPWVERAAGVRRGQDAGVRRGGQGGPAVRCGEHLQVAARALHQAHFGERTTVEWTERGEQTKTAAEDASHGDTPRSVLQMPGVWGPLHRDTRHGLPDTPRPTVGHTALTSEPSPQRPDLPTVQRRPGGEGRSPWVTRPAGRAPPRAVPWKNGHVSVPSTQAEGPAGAPAGISEDRPLPLLSNPK